MINIFRSVSLLLLLLLGSGSFAQSVPGYLGKRNIISYRGLIGPGFQPSGPEIFGFSEQGRPQAKPDGLFNNGLFYENQLNFERVMSRKFSLRAALSQQSFHFGSSLIDDDGYYASFEQERYMSLEKFVPGRALGFEVGARWYYQHFAPMGWYFELHLGYQNVSYEGASFIRQTEDIPVSIISTEAGSINLLTWGFGWGYQRIIQDKYLVGLGTQLTGAAVRSANDVNANMSPEELQEKVGRAAGMGAMSGRFMPFFFTIGYLL